MTSAQRSVLRQRVGDLYRRLGALVELSLDTTPPTFAGVVYQLRTRCGKARCVCREGKPHTAWCASFSEGGRRQLRTVPAQHLRELQVLAERYRLLRRARGRMTRGFSELMRVLDRLEQSLRLNPKKLWARLKAQGK